MTKRSKCGAGLATAMTAGLLAGAQAAPPDASVAEHGNASAGQQIAVQGIAAAEVAACVSCHGAHGEGNAEAGFPRLAGQSASYLARQLADYARGVRKNAVMEPVAKGLSDAQRLDVAAYYASLADDGQAARQAADQAPGQTGKDEAHSRGRQLVDVGDEALQVQACSNCHGPGATGVPPGFPYLAGQPATYITGALNEFRNGARKNDASGQMPFIARQLSVSDIDAVSQYLSSLPAPASDAERQAATQAIRAKAIKGSASAESAGHDKPAPQGTGTEHGAPTTGGGQGPGGGGAGSGTGASGGSGAAPP